MAENDENGTDSGSLLLVYDEERKMFVSAGEFIADLKKKIAEQEAELRKWRTGVLSRTPR